jgi:hypothetical protein
MKLTSTRIAIVLGTAALVAGCGGGGGSSEPTPAPPQVPVNAAPTISAIAAQTIDEDGATDALAFTIGDAETSPDALSVSVSSSNSIVQADGLELIGGGSSRALTIFPVAEQSGNATITIAVRDAAGAVTNSNFELTVRPLLRAKFSEWVRATVLPRALTANPVGEATQDGQPLPQVEDINRIKVQDDAASFDDLIPPEEPEEPEEV